MKSSYSTMLGSMIMLILLANLKLGQCWIVENSFSFRSPKPGAWTYDVMKNSPFGFLSGGEALVTLSCNVMVTKGSSSKVAGNETDLDIASLILKERLQLLLCSNYKDLNTRIISDGSCTSKHFSSAKSCFNLAKTRRACQEPLFVEDVASPERSITINNVTYLGVEFSFDLSFRRRVTSDAFLSAMLVWCCSSQLTDLNFTCTSETTFLNPGKQHLSSDKIPLTVLYLVMGCIWLMLLSMYCVNWAFNFKFSNRLHQILTILPLIKAVLMFVQHVRWTEVSKTDEEPPLVQVARHVLQSFSWASYLLFLMLAAEGWCVIRRRPQLHKYTIGITAMFVSSALLYYYVHRYFRSIAAVLSGLVLYFTLKFAQQSNRLVQHMQGTIRKLITSRQLYHTTKRTLHDRLTAKQNLFRTLMCISVLYPLLFIIFSMVSEFQFKRLSWVRDQSTEYLDLAITLLLLIQFRMHDCKGYHFITLERKNKEINATVLIGPGRQSMYVVETKEDAGYASDNAQDAETNQEHDNVLH